MQRVPPPAYIALGSNLGDRAGHLRFAIEEIGGLRGTRLLAASEFLETEPVGGPAQPAYLNAAASIETELEPRALLEALLGIEERRGRVRAEGERWGPRTLDLDLVLYGGLIVDEPGLTVPHPRMHERRFVLGPLAQIAPGAVIPTLNITVAERLRALDLMGASR